MAGNAKKKEARDLYIELLRDFKLLPASQRTPELAEKNFLRLAMSQTEIELMKELLTLRHGHRTFAAEHGWKIATSIMLDDFLPA
jgi:hypothetical protein